MVFNSAAVVAIADVSTETWQLMWRIPSSQRINTRQLVDMAVCYPMYQLSRLVLCLWTFMCLPPDDSFYSYTYHNESHSSSSSSSLSDDADDEDRLAFEHNLYQNHRVYDSDDDDDDDRSSSSSFDDYYSPYSHYD
ncbi:hypothetical protein Rs2_03531 [Raphanus sativus]|uniref:Uncharacterized protein LOC108852267 n=1 Tax=Raphanus sativus TaxID=3726 RepID=A0A6J0N9V2_RAPSA|nr:uncharacterized protein LOC108852267 [Raphanus sativus]KAJ4917981.1 hypothetical protein Rs2_03531 [Raphanus sativus]